MADTLVSALLQQPSSRIIKKIEQEVGLISGVKGEVKKFESKLRAIKSVLADAEEKQSKNTSIKQWLDKLKDVSYDMDDVLDEWSTAILKSQIEGNQFAPRGLIKSRVGSLIRSSCFCCNRVGQRHYTAHKIKDLNRKLDDIVKEKELFSFSVGKGAGKIDRNITSSFIDVTEVKGREKDKKNIIDMLLSENNETPKPHIISIYGVGGLGKTTLAKLVFNDIGVETHFEQRIWVCVSDPFDEFRIAKAILESFKDDTSNLQWQTMLQRVQQYIRGKRFLLVLDDVWNVNSAFDDLKHALACGLPKSKILVTTRKWDVATIMGCTFNDIFQLGLLSKNECWSMFSQVAFFGKTDRERKELRSIGDEIVDRCKGLPLAAKTLGGLLRFRKSRQEWESVLESKVWELEEATEDLFGPLWLSYYDLPSALRQCFSYCAVFPKDHEIEKYKLIELWIAQGYLKETESEDMEMVGEMYFRNLAMRSLFQDFVYNEYGSIRKCKLHDIVHDFAQFLSRSECFIMEVTGSKKDTNRMDNFCEKETTRHVGMVLLENGSLPMSFYNLRKLRSLMIHESNFIMEAALPGLFNHLTCMRSLDISDSDLREIPPTISNLIHLRWLDLAHNKGLVELPKTICELYNLQTLDISWCRGLVKLPHSIAKLINLRHLHNMGLKCLIPKGIGRLTCLRTLNELIIGNGDETASLADLEKLEDLRGSLMIRCLGNETANVNEAKMANLKKKKHLVDLELNFEGEEEGDWRIGHDEELIEALEPSPNLESLVIVNFMGAPEFPLWMMSLINMKKLVLVKCVNWKHLPPLGKLSSLEYLQIGEMNGVKKVSTEFLGRGFPNLTKLEFREMSEWEEWDMDEILREENGDDATVMPRLRSLKIEHCPKLVALPQQLLQRTPPLEVLRSFSCPALECRYVKWTGQWWYTKSNMPFIQIGAVLCRSLSI